MNHGSGQLLVPPGFRFHPTDEELLQYYLRKKVTHEAIDLDVIREIDLNKLEPWDLKERCGIGSGAQSEWYFFCHKDRKYPTGSRTNRATAAGFWKATGRDKSIHHSSSKRIGMRKTLVFYVGRAPHGQKTDWIMHEYRLDDDFAMVQEDGWVVCRVFKKNSLHKTIPATAGREAIGEENTPGLPPIPPQPYRQSFLLPLDLIPFENAMHLPQLLSSEPPTAAAAAAVAAFLPAPTMNAVDHDRSRDIMKLSGSGGGYLPTEKAAGDWSILEKLLAGHQSQLEQLFQAKCCPPSQILEMGSSAQPQTRFPLSYLCAEADLLKYSKQA